MNTIRVVLTTIDDAEKAYALAAALVEESKAACVNIIPNVTSVYKWEGKVQTDNELLLVIKVTQEGVDGLADRIKELHPYDVPEVVSLPVEKGNPAYLEWVHDSVR